MWDFLTKKCGIFGIEGGTKLWDFQHRGGDFRPLTSGHTGYTVVVIVVLVTLFVSQWTKSPAID